MRHLLEWLWHGEDVGRRLMLVLVAVGNVMLMLEHWPIHPDEWFRALAHLLVAGATAAASKPTNGHGAKPDSAG